MSTHLFAIGDTVSLNFHEGNFFSKLDPFVIEAQMPPLGTSLQYRVKSKAEACRRVVAEHQLSPFGSQPGTEPTIFLAPSGLDPSTEAAPADLANEKDESHAPTHAFRPQGHAAVDAADHP